VQTVCQLPNALIHLTPGEEHVPIDNSNTIAEVLRGSPQTHQYVHDDLRPLPRGETRWL
jgi:hypothetical protein